MRHEIHTVFHALDVQPRCRPVPRVDADGLQSRQLLEETAVFPEIHHAVQLDVIAAAAEHPMFEYQLFIADTVLHAPQIDEPVDEYRRTDAADAQKQIRAGCLLKTGTEEPGDGHYNKR